MSNLLHLYNKGNYLYRFLFLIFAHNVPGGGGSCKLQLPVRRDHEDTKEGGGGQVNFIVIHVQSRSSLEKCNNLFHFVKGLFR